MQTVCHIAFTFGEPSTVAPLGSGLLVSESVLLLLPYDKKVLLSRCVGRVAGLGAKSIKLPWLDRKPEAQVPQPQPG